VASRARSFGDFYRRRPKLAWGGTAIVIGVIAAVVVIVAVGGGIEEADVHVKCTVSNSDGSIVLTVTGKVTEKEAKNGCNELAARFSGEGRYWRVGLPQVPSAGPEITCGFNAPAGRHGTVMVERDPERSGIEATAICGQFAHEGWTQFTHGGVMGPWQQEYGEAVAAEEESDATEAEIAEEENEELEAEQAAIEVCEEQAEVVEAEDIAAIERSVKAKIAAAPSEERGWEIEEEGWAAEEDVWSRTEEADARCDETGGAESGSSAALNTGPAEVRRRF
jgi:hypothetical protein